jgi:hypothetical protein
MMYYTTYQWLDRCLWTDPDADFPLPSSGALEFLREDLAACQMQSGLHLCLQDSTYCAHLLHSTVESRLEGVLLRVWPEY